MNINQNDTSSGKVSEVNISVDEIITNIEQVDNITNDESLNHEVLNNTIESIQNINNYIDYDNLDSDDDIDENTESNNHEEITKKGKGRTFSCDECDHTSCDKSSLTKHVKSVHKKGESNISKRKRETDNLPSRKKTKGGKYSCDECIYKTNSKQSLKKHKETKCESKLD